MRAGLPLVLLALLAATPSADAYVRIVSAVQKFVHGYEAPPEDVLGRKCTVVTGPKDCHGWACVQGKCSACIHDAECTEMSEVYSCNLGQPGHATAGDCVLKPMSFSQLTRAEIGAGAMAFFISAFSSVAGIGGGGMLVPLYILAVGFPPTLAVSMSQATILGGAGLNMVIKMMRGHPARSGPLIDYDVAMMMMPMTLTGTVIGHMMGRVMPDWLRLGGLVLLLSYMLKKTLKKAKASAARDGIKQTATSEESVQLLVKGDKGDIQGSGPTDQQIQLAQAVAARRAQFPKAKLLFMFVLWNVLVYSSYVKHQFVGCGTLAYWGVLLFVLGSMLALTATAGTMLQKRDQQMCELGYQMKEDEIEWTWNAVLLYPAMSITAGMGASLLGIGGGMVLGIIFAELGKMDEQVMAATAALATALVASKASTEFWLYGEMPLDYAAFFVICGCLGTVIGQGPIDYYIRMKQKRSWIIYSLAAIIAGSLVALAVAGTINVYRTWMAGGSMSFHSLCKA